VREQRPVPARNAGAVACLAVFAGLAGGCSGGEVPVDAPALTGAAAKACGKLVRSLPQTVSDQSRRLVDPGQAYGAAWGDPAIVLRCGVRQPKGLDRFATCQETNGVGWFVPEEQIEDQSADVLMTTIGFAQNVQVRVPAQYRPPAAAMVDLGDAIKQAILEVKPCL